MLTGIVAARLPPVARFFETGPGSVFAMVALATALVLVAVLTDSVGLWLVASVVYWTMLGLVLFLCIAGLVGLETRRCILSCSVASAVSSLIHGFVGIVDEGDEAIVLLCLAAVLSLAACLLCHREAVGTLRVASDSSDAPADLMYTQPSSFLPLWHGLYLLLLLFGFVAGMSLNFGGSGLGDNATPLSAVPIGVIAVYLLCSRRSVKFDFLHFVAVALAAAAFLSVGFINQRPLVVTAGLFGSAEGCFWAFIPALLIVLARRNDRNVVVVLGWGLGMFLLGWGVIPWAFNCLAHALPDEVPLMMFPLAWLFIVFNMWALRHMSLDAVIQSIVPAQDIIVHASQGDELLDDRSRAACSFA